MNVKSKPHHLRVGEDSAKETPTSLSDPFLRISGRRMISLGLHTLRAGELITHTAKSALLETSGVLYVLTFGDL